MRLDLLRHGDTDRGGYLDGRTDLPMTEAGRTQISKNAENGRWPVVVSSPLVRARWFADVLSRDSSCRVLIDPNWAELDFGRWDGHLRADIEADAGERERLMAFYADPHKNSPPDGESWLDFESRVRHALESVYAAAAGQRALVITHAGPMRMALSIVLGLPLSALWSIRIGYATRVGVELGRHGNGDFWGELVEIVQS